MKGIERRKSDRFAASVPVGIRFSKGRVKEGWGRILDISASGLLVETRFEAKAASVIYVSFNLRNGTGFENLRSRVIRSRYEDGYHKLGLVFDDVVDNETLGDVLAALATEGGISIS